MHTFLRNSCSVLLALSCSACGNNSKNPNDPNKEFNKSVHQFNMDFDDNLLRPVAVTYDDCVASGVQEVVEDCALNLKEPYFFINHILSGEGALAIDSVFRFLINSTIGFCGFIDVAKEMDIARKEVTYKDTLRSIGVETGNYLVLPFFGPSSTRDALAEPVSWFMDPVSYFIGMPWMCAKFVISEINYRSRNRKVVDMLKENKDATYPIFKSIYTQKYAVKKPKKDEN